MHVIPPDSDAEGRENLLCFGLSALTDSGERDAPVTTRVANENRGFR